MDAEAAPGGPGSLAGGEMGERIRAHDWAATPLGPFEGWPRPLRTAVGIMLGANSPMGIYWGPGLVLLYNDRWRELVGGKHPQALGHPAREVFPEIWKTIGPMFASIMAGMGGGEARDQLLPLERHGRIEDAWFNYSFSPIPLEDGTIGGVLNLAFETTARLTAERAVRASEARQAFLLALGDELRGLADPRGVMEAAAGLLGRHLSTDRAGYAEIDASGETFTVEHDWCAPGMPSLAGHHRLDDFGPALIAEFRAGRSVAFEDALAGPLTPGEGAAAAYRGASTRAAITVPLVKDGRFAAALYVHAREPRSWTGEDAALVREVAERTWAAVERARAEAALRDSEQRFRTALEIGTVGVIFFDTEGAISDANDAFLRMGGYSREDLAAGRLRWDAMTPPEWMPASLRAIEELKAGGSTTPYEKEYYHKDGSRWWALFAAKALGGGSGVEFVLDITDAKRAAAALRASEARLARLLATTPAGVVEMDADGRFAYANAAAERVLGAEPGGAGGPALRRPGMAARGP